MCSGFAVCISHSTSTIALYVPNRWTTGTRVEVNSISTAGIIICAELGYKLREQEWKKNPQQSHDATEISLRTRQSLSCAPSLITGKSNTREVEMLRAKQGEPTQSATDEHAAIVSAGSHGATTPPFLPMQPASCRSESAEHPAGRCANGAASTDTPLNDMTTSLP